MQGAPQCWRCGVALGRQPYSAPYAGRRPRALSWTVLTFLGCCFLCALSGLALYFLWPRIELWRQVGVAKSDQSGNSTPELDTRHGNQELLKDQTAPGSAIAGIQSGMKKSEVKDKLGDPVRMESGYWFDKENGAPLWRELWVYQSGWVLFRYELVVQSGPNPPPILSKQLTGAPGSYGGGQ
jgi:hypothetical protein